MSDIVDTSPLGIERTERIAGDEALHSRLDSVHTGLQQTQESVTTEVLHRSEGDLVIQRILEGYIQELLEGKAEDFERYIEFQNDQNLNYADVRNFVGAIRASLAKEIGDLSISLMTNLQANDLRYNKLVSDVDKYLEILSDITLDSNQITLDNGELRAGAWTILSQARKWDLEIISRLNGLSESVGDSLKDAVEEIQNTLPSTEETISKAIEELSKSPLIKELSDLLNQSIENDIAYELALLEQARKHANDMAQLADDMRLKAESTAKEMEDYMAGEVTARILEVNKEVAARKEAIDALTADMISTAETSRAEYLEDMRVVTARIKDAEDGLTTEIQHRKDGDSSTLNALNTYKVSNDSAITGLSTSLSNNVTKTNANTTLINGLSSRLTTAEEGIESATTAAADAMSKATTAVSANNALSLRVDALAASITESEGTVVDVNAFNALKAEVTTVKGVVTGLVEDVTTLENNYSSINNKVTSQGTAISNLNTKMIAAENGISQSANDITLLKTTMVNLNTELTYKVDSQAFNQLSSDVSDLDGKYTTQASLVTDLRGSLETTNLNVSNAASAAQNALNEAGSKGKVIYGTTAPAVADRLSQNLWIDTTGNANTPKRWNGSSWVVVRDKVASDALAAANAATTLVNTKADTSAFNSLDQKVTVMDGKVSANTNSITSLGGKLSIVEGNVATKLDSSAISNYYTKTQADGKALEIASGKVEEFKATLSGEGVNLFPYDMSVLNSSNGTWGGSGFTIRSEPGMGLTEGDRAYKVTGAGNAGNYVYSGRGVWTTPTEPGADYIVSLYVKSPVAKPVRIRQIGFNASGVAGLRAAMADYELEADVWKRISIKYTADGSHEAIGWAIYHNMDGAPASDDNYVLISRPMAERTYGTSDVPSNWVEGGGVSNQVSANTSAIQSIDSDLKSVDGKVTANTTLINNLSSRITNIDGTKLDASVISGYYTKAQTEDKAQEIAAGEVSKYSADLRVGGINLADKYEDGRAFSTASYQGSRIQVTARPDLKDDMVSSSDPFEVSSTGGTGTLKTTPQLVAYKDAIVVITFKVKNLATTPMGIRFNGLASPVIIKGGDLGSIAPDVIQEFEVTGRMRPDYNWAQFQLFTNVAGNDIKAVLADVQLEVGNKATSWKPPAYLTQQALDANATAINNTNAEVTRVDGRVTTESNRITTLTGRVSTVEGQVSTKADVSAVNALNTRVGNVEGGLVTQANNTTALEAKLSTTMDVASLIANSKLLYPDTAFDKGTNSVGAYSSVSGKVSVARIARWTLDNPTTSSGQLNVTISAEAVPNYGGFAQYIQTRANAVFVVRYLLKLPVGYSLVPNGNAKGTGGTDEFVSSVEGTGKYETYIRLIKCGSAGSFSSVGHVSVRGTALTGTQTLTFPVASIEAYDATDYSIAHPDVLKDLAANAEAITSTNAEVSRIDGVVKSQGTQITNLSGTIAGKADANALSSLAARVTAEEGKTVSQANDIVALDSKLDSRNSYSLIPDYYLANSDEWVSHYGYNLSSQFTTTQQGSIGPNIFFKRNAPTPSPSNNWNYSKTRLPNNRKYKLSMLVRGVAGAEGLHYFTGRTFDAKGDQITYLNTQVTTQAPADGKWHHVTAVIDWTDNVAATIAFGFAVGHTGDSSKGWWMVQGFSVKDVITVDDTDSSVAATTALNSLTTEVSRVNGVVTTQASQLTVLTSDNNNNKNALSVQGKVIDGVKSSYMVKMESNGVIGGFGMIQNTGNMGAVTTSFGVSADAFFIGAPASKKQPFIVTTANQVVNGVTYPAGTYIDVALIANATIGTAKIANLAVTAAKIANATITNAEIANATITGAKIANATIGTAQIANLAVTGAKIANATITSAEIANAAITTAKIGDLQVDTIKIKDNAVTSLLEVQKVQQQIDKDFPALPTNGQASVKIRVELLSGLSKHNRYLVYWRGKLGAGMSTKVSNPPPWRGWGRKRLYFGSTSSTDITGTKVLAEVNQLNGNHVMWYQNDAVSIGDTSQWNVAEGIVDDTGTLCLWADVEWKSFADPMTAGSLYAYVYMSELNVLISEFKK